MGRTGAIESKRIKIRAKKVEVIAELDNSDTSQSVMESLPAQATANLWGDEIYFTLPVECCQTNMQEVVEMGDIGYWVPGQAMCLFFGPTPASRGDEIRPASKVHVFGKIVGDPTVLRAVGEGEQLTLERA
ncbi:MAG: hypothetical protein GTN69_04395 [Armatimonadetes bacterium]|nr:hypothetical protein [Armatimonadota bacterium]NIO75124.1 hypothetical protein [Armatimonadota bacterium]NIO95748.1 hypothetical protein [Armatimonadota bacterium]